jgi:hypothetical protein
LPQVTQEGVSSKEIDRRALVDLAHKHRAAIIDLMRRMTQPERISFRQAMIASMTDAMMGPPASEPTVRS